MVSEFVFKLYVWLYGNNWNNDFEKYCKQTEADVAVIDSAKSLAMTVLDCWADPDLLNNAKEFFAS